MHFNFIAKGEESVIEVLDRWHRLSAEVKFSVLIAEKRHTDEFKKIPLTPQNLVRWGENALQFAEDNKHFAPAKAEVKILRESKNLCIIQFKWDGTWTFGRYVHIDVIIDDDVTAYVSCSTATGKYSKYLQWWEKQAGILPPNS